MLTWTLCAGENQRPVVQQRRTPGGVPHVTRRSDRLRRQRACARHARRSWLAWNVNFNSSTAPLTTGLDHLETSQNSTAVRKLSRSQREYLDRESCLLLPSIAPQNDWHDSRYNNKN